MITTATAPFVIEAGSELSFDGSSIRCEPTYNEASNWFSVMLFVVSSASGNTLASTRMQVTAAEVDAETGVGSGETGLWFNALQQAVITKLEAMSGNESTAFSVA